MNGGGIYGPPAIPSRKKAGVPLSAQNEIQAIIYSGAVATSGSFKATVTKPDSTTGTTTSLGFGALHTSIITALVAAGATGAVGTTNTTPALINGTNGIACYVTFSGTQGNAPVPLITIDNTNGGSGGLVGGTLAVKRIQAGYAGDFAGAAVGDLAMDTTTGVVYRNAGTSSAPIWTPTPPFMRGGNTLVVDGDSITYHNADSYDSVTLTQGGQSYPTPMMIECDGAMRLLKIAAWNGNNTSHLLAHFEAEVLPYLPAYYMMLIGINDQAASYATSEALAVSTAIGNIKALLDKCFLYGIQPIVSTLLPNSQTSFATGGYGTVTNRHSYIARFNATLKAMIANYPRKVFLLDPHWTMSDGAGNYIAAYTTDLLHPNGKGQSVLGNFYAAELVKIIGSDAPQQWLIDTSDQGPNAIANGLMRDGFLTGFTSLVGGSGYGASSTITLSGGGGAGATATPTISGGVITAITVNDPGSGYTSAPTVTVNAIGGGSGASATATINGAANGIPDSWSTFGAAATNTCVAPPTGVAGQAAKILPPANQASGLFQDVNSSAGLGYAAGDHMLIAGRVLTNGMSTSGQVSVSVACQVSPNVTLLYTVNALPSLTPADYPNTGRFGEEFVIPATCGNLRVLAQGVGDAGGTAYVEYMQFTLINLTRAGYPTAFPAGDPRF